jgi:hypothetical protein
MSRLWWLEIGFHLALCVLIAVFIVVGFVGWGIELALGKQGRPTRWFKEQVYDPCDETITGYEHRHNCRLRYQ